MFNKINTHNDWDKLREIIVGTNVGSTPTITWNRKEKIDIVIIISLDII